MPTWGDRIRLPRRDVLLALALFALAETELVLSGWTHGSVVSAAVYTLPITLRRRLPIVAAAGLVAAPALGRTLDGLWETTLVFSVASLIVAYSVAAYGSRRTAVLGGLLALTGSALGETWSAEGDPEVAVMVALMAGPWLAGWFAGPLRRETEELSALAAQLERQREANARLAVIEERARLARELHDAVAHAVSAMVVQGAAAEAVLSASPAEACRSLRTVQTLGRESVTELRRMLRILRTTADDGMQPEPGGRPGARMRQRGRHRWSPRHDAILAVVCFVVAEWVVLTQFLWDSSRLAGAALMAVATLPLALRRRFPLAVLLTSTVAVALHQHLLDPVPMPASVAIPILIGLYTVGAHDTPRRAIAGAAVAVVTAAVVDAALWDEGMSWFLLVYSLIGGSLVVSGYAVRLHRRNAEQLHMLTERLRREGDALARLAVVDERTRVARELHDTIAHGVSVMVLQAGAAEQVMTSSPEQSRQAAHAVQDTGRSVLEELNRLLGVLHTDEEDSPRAPQPSLAHLDALVNRVRHAGLPVELRVDGEPTGLTPGVDASAYRVIQEALTNALKHAGPVPTAVTVCYEPTSIALEVLSEDDHSDGRPIGQSGHGLVGMRERVELYGGELRAGPEPSGGFAVRAHLPLEGGGE